VVDEEPPRNHAARKKWTGEDERLLKWLAEITVRRWNEIAGQEILRFEPVQSRVKKSSGGPVPSLVIRIALEEHATYHGITHWDCAWNPLHPNWKKRAESLSQIVIGLGMKPKSAVPLRRRTNEYYSTLTHEMGHCLGLMHFPGDARLFAEEIMAPKRGGTLIPPIPKHLDQAEMTEADLPPLKASPYTRAAVRWVYGPRHPQLRDRAGQPVYCNSCKVLGWHYPD
jgi:hypothetical protein